MRKNIPYLAEAGLALVSTVALGSLGILAYDKESRDRIRERSTRSRITHEGIQQRVLSVVTGWKTEGIPCQAAHNVHDRRLESYNNPEGGNNITIYEHWRQHIQHQELWLKQYGHLKTSHLLADTKTRLANGLTFRGNRSAIEKLEITIAIFEMYVFDVNADKNIVAYGETYFEQMADKRKEAIEKGERGFYSVLRQDEVDVVIGQAMDLFYRYRNLDGEFNRRVMDHRTHAPYMDIIGDPNMQYLEEPAQSYR
jgi:hypothetical protein